MGVDLSISSTLSSKRSDNIMQFSTGVGKGMHDVHFYNTGAERFMGGNGNDFLSASSSFGLASCTSLERSSFCDNLLSEMESDLNSLYVQLNIQAISDVKKAAIGDPKLQKATGLEKIAEEKKQEEEAKMKNELSKNFDEISYNLKTLGEFNSDAGMRFKSLKEAADNQETMAKKQYYNFSTSGTGGIGRDILDNKKEHVDDPKEKDSKTDSAKGSSNQSNKVQNNFSASSSGASGNGFTPLLLMA
ncbi:MAG: hypothetical protein AB1782_02915 [Cyanobacteriota bacterium]